MDETATTNELIDRLVARLSPEARDVQEELDAIADNLDVDAPAAEVEARMEEAIALMAALPEDDQLLLQQIAQLKGRAYERRGEEYEDDARIFEEANRVFARVFELERAAGRQPDESITLGDALELLKRHGEDVPAIDTERVVEVRLEPEEEVRDEHDPEV